MLTRRRRETSKEERERKAGNLSSPNWLSL